MCGNSERNARPGIWKQPTNKQTKQSQSRNHGITFPGEIKNCVKVIGTAHICTPAFLLHSLHIKHSYGVTALYLSIAMLVD